MKKRKKDDGAYDKDNGDYKEEYDYETEYDHKE